MTYIGLLMISHEDDVLEAVLQEHTKIVETFYVLDGTEPVRDSEAICRSFRECAGYTHDSDLPAEYGPVPRDGWRQYLYEQAVADNGFDNWFLLLHGDEVWTFDPEHVMEMRAGADGFVFPLPCYFPREEWDYNRTAFEQLTWHLSPGWPEFRMFRGAPHVHYDVTQHFDVTPRGLRNIVRIPHPIKHYPYRSPEVQRQRAQRHEQTGFDPDNYRHIVDGDNVIWDEAMIAGWLGTPHFREVQQSGSAASPDRA